MENMWKLFNMNSSTNNSKMNSFDSLYEALNFVGSTSGLYINETLVSPQSESKWSSLKNILPLVLGFFGLIFNILALLIFTTSKTFRKNSFHYYIYAFALMNCASVLSHSWLYLTFYLVNPIHLCKYLQYFQQSTATSSLWIMVLLSLERSLTFSVPFTVKRLLQSRAICIILLLVTCLCFALHIDELISVDIKAFRWVNFAYGICSVKRHFHILTERIKIITHANSFILPFLFNSILDVYICYKICHRQDHLANQSLSLLLSSNTKHKRKQRLKHKSLAQEITLTLLCQSLWLLVTYFPTHFYYFLISFKLTNDHDRDNSPVSFFMRLNLLTYLAFSPTLYVILSPTLRKEIYMHTCKSKDQRRAINLSTASNQQIKIRNCITDPTQNQLGIIKGFRSSISLTLYEQKPRTTFLTTVHMPKKIQCLSSSAPCLFASQKESSHNRKFERSYTIHH